MTKEFKKVPPVIIDAIAKEDSTKRIKNLPKASNKLKKATESDKDFDRRWQRENN
jgi:hypothetical protein